MTSPSAAPTAPSKPQPTVTVKVGVPPWCVGYQHATREPPWDVRLFLMMPTTGSIRPVECKYRFDKESGAWDYEILEPKIDMTLVMSFEEASAIYDYAFANDVTVQISWFRNAANRNKIAADTMLKILNTPPHYTCGATGERGSRVIPVPTKYTIEQVVDRSWNP